jgi:hypothetical protein
VRVPSLAGLGAPDAVYRSFDVPGGRVSLVYTGRPGFPESADGVGLLVTEFRGRAERDLLVKTAGPGTRIRHLQVHGYPGVWITGAPHEIFYVGPNGDIEQDTVHLSGNALLWQEGGVILRVEGPKTLDQALTIADSMG